VTTNDEDPDANLNRGKYLCFVRGRWPEGLALLARGSDTTLAGIAAQDLANPTAADAQLALAEAWEDWSKGQTQEPLVGALRRALHWYARAVPQLENGPQKQASRKLAKVDDRLAPWLWSAARRLPWFDGPPGVLHAFAGTGPAAPLIAALRNARYAVLGYHTGGLVVWDLITGHERARQQGVLKSPRQIVMAGDSPIVVCGNQTRDLALYDLGNGKATVQRQPQSVTYIAAAHAEPVFAWAMSASSAKKNSLIAWHVGQGGRPPSFTTAYPVRALALSPDGRTLIVGDDHSQLVSLDLVTGKELGRMALPAAPARVQISPDGRFLLVDLNNQMIVYGTADGNEVGHVPDEYRVAAFSPRSGHLVAAGTATGRLDLWDLTAQRVVSSVSVPSSAAPTRIDHVQPLSDARAVIVTGRGGTAYLVRIPDVQPAAMHANW